MHVHSDLKPTINWLQRVQIEQYAYGTYSEGSRNIALVWPTHLMQLMSLSQIQLLPQAIKLVIYVFTHSMIKRKLTVFKKYTLARLQVYNSLEMARN